MTRPEYESICKGVKEGSTRYVEDALTHAVGKVTACEGTRFQVEIENHQESWPSESCREKWQ